MLTLILILIITTFLYFYFKKKYSYWKDLGIPGPNPYPFIGTYLAENQFSNGKKQEREFLKKYGPVWGCYHGVTPMLNTCDPEHVKQVLGDENTFQNFGLFTFKDRYGSRGFFFKNGHEWKQARRVASTHFTSRKMKSLLGYFDKATDNFLKNVEFVMRTQNTDVIDVKKMGKFFAVDMICKYVLAIDVDSFRQHESGSEFAKQALLLGKLNYGHLLLLSFLPKSIGTFLGLTTFSAEQSNALGDMFKRMRRERDPKLKYNDLSEVLQDAVNEGKLKMSEDDIVGNCVSTFFAGSDTTSLALSMVFYRLIDNPKIQDKLYEELKKDFADGEITYDKLTQQQYLDAVLNESFRLDGTSLQSFDKVAAKDVVLEKGNIKLKKGTIVFLINHLIQTNEQYYPNPYEFKPERFLDKSSSNENQIRNGTYQPFGMGNRICIGMRFALLEIKYLIVRILLNYALLKPGGFKLEETSIRSQRFCFPNEMKVVFKKRT